jgi:hypothetical protein
LSTFEKLKQLKCLPELVSRVKHGESSQQIADWLQHEKKQLTQDSNAKVRALILAFTRELGALTLIQSRAPQYFHDAMDKVEKSVNELDEIGWLYSIQKERVLNIYESEKKSGYKNGAQNTRLQQEMKVAADLLKTSHQIKMDVTGSRNLGTLTVAPAGTVTHMNVSERFGDDIAGVLEEPEKRQRVLDTVRRAFALTEVQKANVIDQT